jgi:serine/threonine protein kinase
MPLLIEGNMVAGKYRLERSLAKGGMGSVWIARHVHLNMLVAIKFMDTGAMASEEARTRFDREAKAAAQIQSPHVAQVHDYGVEDDVPYIAMELLHGEDLGRRLRRERRLPLEEVAKILSQAAKALRKAHDAGLIHRDLKPANIFLARTDDDEEIVKVLDFGVVKVAAMGIVTDATRTGIVVGSVNYMSPEQARGLKDLDHRSDLWSLGVLAFRAIVGQHPFPGDQVGDVIVRICSEPIPVPSELAPDLGPEIDAFFRRALARDITERFQSARDFATSLSMLAGVTSLAGTGAWPLAFAARLPMQPVSSPLSQGKGAVIREGDALRLSPQLGSVERSSPNPQSAPPRWGSEVATEEAAPLSPNAMGSPGLEPSSSSSSDSWSESAGSPGQRPSPPSLNGGGTLTDAPRVSDVAPPPVSSAWGKTRLFAAGGVALALLIGGVFLFRRSPPAPAAPAAPSPSLSVSPAEPPTEPPAESAEVKEVEPPSSAPVADPLPPMPSLSGSTKASAAPTKSSHAPAGKPPKVSPQNQQNQNQNQKINPTLGI